MQLTATIVKQFTTAISKNGANEVEHIIHDRRPRSVYRRHKHDFENKSDDRTETSKTTASAQVQIKPLHTNSLKTIKSQA